MKISKCLYVLLVCCLTGITGAAQAQAQGANDCMNHVRAGNVDWGGGTKWQPANIDRLCANAQNLEPVECFKAGLAQGLQLQDAITFCRADSQHCVKQASSARPSLPGVNPWRQRFQSCNIGEAPPAEIGDLDLPKTACGRELARLQITLRAPEIRQLCGEVLQEAGGASALCFSDARNAKLNTAEATRLCANITAARSRGRPVPRTQVDCYRAGIAYGKQRPEVIDLCKPHQERFMQNECLGGGIMDPRTGDYRPENWKVAYQRCFG